MLEGRWLTIPQHFPRTATEMVPNHTPFGCVADNDRTDLTSSILRLSKLLSLVLVVMRFLRYRLLLSADHFAQCICPDESDGMVRTKMARYRCAFRLLLEHLRRNESGVGNIQTKPSVMKRHTFRFSALLDCVAFFFF